MKVKLTGKKILVMGLGRSGMATAELLLREAAIPLLNDAKPPEAFGNSLERLRKKGAILRFTQEPRETLEDADMVVISPGISINSPLASAARTSGIPIIGELELGSLFDTGKIIAVTGTNGKTTTTSLIGEILKASGRDAIVAGNIGNPYTRAILENKRHEFSVLEVSSFQLESVMSFHPSTALLLNIAEDHLERHDTMQEYIRLKFKIFKNQNSDDIAVLNDDSPLLRKPAQTIKSRVLRFSRFNAVSEGAYIKSNHIVFRLDGNESVIAPVADIVLPGEHNIENVLAAICAVRISGIEADTIRETIRQFKSLEHRIEYVRKLNGIRYFNDSKGTNVDSTIRAIRSIEGNMAVILGGYDKQADFKPLADEIKNNANHITGIVLIGQTANKINQVLNDVGFKHIVYADNLEEAVHIASSMLPGDGGSVLFSPACASFDMFADYEQRGRFFKEIVWNLEKVTTYSSDAGSSAKDMRDVKGQS